MIRIGDTEIPHIYLGNNEISAIYCGNEQIYPFNVETNKIYYTSSNGNIVTPYSTSGFGANIVSNTYVGGQGIIEFDGPVTGFGERAFQNCTTLSSIIMPDSVVSVGGWTFMGCSSLTAATISNSLSGLSNSMFNSVGFTSFKIPNNIKILGEAAFYGCTGLTTMEIPATVETISPAVFMACSGLTSITCLGTTPATLAGDSRNTFQGTYPIYVPCESVDTYKASWSSYASRIQCDEPTDIPLQWIGNGVSSSTPTEKNVYFDTGFPLSGSLLNCAFEITFEYPTINNSSSTQQVILGAYENTTSCCRFIANNAGSYKIDFGTYTATYSVVTSPSAGTFTLRSWLYGQKVYGKFNNSIKTSSSSSSSRNGTNHSFYLFGQHQNGLTKPSFGGAKIYNVKLYKNVTTTSTDFSGTPIREYKPMLHWNGTEYIPCFKEINTGTYIYNLGNDSVNYG